MSPPRPKKRGRSALQKRRAGERHANASTEKAKLFSLTLKGLANKYWVSADLSEQLAGA
jgi:hypothetical protein